MYFTIYLTMESVAGVGCLLILILGGPQNMSRYELAMLVIAFLTLIVNAVALFKQMKE